MCEEEEGKRSQRYVRNVSRDGGGEGGGGEQIRRGVEKKYNVTVCSNKGNGATATVWLLHSIPLKGAIFHTQTYSDRREKRDVQLGFSFTRND